VLPLHKKIQQHQLGTYDR